MNQPSAFQIQYPLSPKKFWKKVIPNLFTYLILALIPGVAIGYFLYAMEYSAENNNVSVMIGSIILFTLIFYVIFVLLYVWYIKAYIKRYYYDCGDQFVTIKKGVFTPTEIHVQYQKIQDVYVDQDLLDRIFGLYDVHIASATVTSGIEAHIDGVNAEVAENLKNIILAKIKGDMAEQIHTQSSSIVETKPLGNPTFRSSVEVSTNTYPINEKWKFVALGSSFIFSLIVTLFVSIYTASFFWGTGVLFVLVLIMRFVWLLVWKKNYYFELTPDYILLRTGVLGRQENHLPYKSIQNITNKQGLVERLVGLATVSVENAAQIMVQNSRGRRASKSVGIALVGQMKNKAEELNKILNDIVSSQGNMKKMGL